MTSKLYRVRQGKCIAGVCEGALLQILKNAKEQQLKNEQQYE